MDLFIDRASSIRDGCPRFSYRTPIVVLSALCMCYAFDALMLPDDDVRDVHATTNAKLCDFKSFSCGKLIDIDIYSLWIFTSLSFHIDNSRSIHYSVRLVD